MQVILHTGLAGPFPAEAMVNRMAATGYEVGIAEAADRSSAASAFSAPAAALARLGLEGAAPGVETTARATPIKLPRIGIFRGRGAAYPYYAYYAHSLAALGYGFSIVDGPDIAAGCLDETDVLILPGGFAIWGLDRCERVVGADDAVRRFLERGGGAIGSCGGAFYLSAGRPGWLGFAEASPRYTHEYLRSGAGIVSVEMAPGPLATGSAPCVEMPYYHGPIYQSVRPTCDVAARFASLSLAARIPIDNPLDEARFSAEMAGCPAILTVEREAGRAVLFSPHPEMGDLVRKYAAIQSYVETYLPIRGSQVMEETLDFYQPNNAPAFRLLFNAVRFVAPSPKQASAHPVARPVAESAEPAVLAALIGDELKALKIPGEGVGTLLDRERGKLLQLADRLSDAPPFLLDEGMQTVLADARAFIRRPSPQQSSTQRLLDLELPLRLIEVVEHRNSLDATLLEHQPAA